MKDGLTELEKKFASAWCTDPVNNQVFDPNSSHCWQGIRKIVRETAYHEAGHYVARCFTGLEYSHVMFLSIMPDKINNGRMRCERCITECTLESFSPSLQRPNGRKLLLEILAGAGVEIRIDDEGLGCESILYYWDNYCDDEKYMEGTDYFRASRIATIMEKPHMPAHRILSLADKWTMEMLTIPVVWNAVETVADKLLELGEINGEELSNIIDTSTGFEVDFYRKLPKWRRRFSP
jgi:hypothetical protein